MKSDHQTYDYFIGRIPPFLQFELELESLFYIVENHKDDRWYPENNPASQVATIGLFAYFEAFCKHQFAAIVNIFPSLIFSFAAKRGEPKIEFSTILTFNGEFEKHIGSVLAEQYDFGTTKSINSIFHDLLSITPFSNVEAEKFNKILYKRNLLVHHAGYYTLKYAKKNLITIEQKQKAFKEAVKIDTEECHDISNFLFEMALKITRQSVYALKRHSEFQSLNPEDERVLAIEDLFKAVWDTIE
jgi:hypothetical protein